MKTRKLTRAMTQGPRIFATLVLLAGCGTSGAISAPPDASATASSPTPSAEPLVDVHAPGCGTVHWSDVYAPLTIPMVAGAGWGFVVAEMTAVEPAIFNTEDGTKPLGFMERPDPSNPDAYGKIFTPYVVQVDQVMGGRTRIGENRVLIEGGTVGCSTTSIDVSPELHKGTRYILILTDPQNAQGKKLLDFQEVKFAWIVLAGGMVGTVDGPMSLDELARIVADASVVPRP